MWNISQIKDHPVLSSLLLDSGVFQRGGLCGVVHLSSLTKTNRTLLSDRSSATVMLSLALWQYHLASKQQWYKISGTTKITFFFREVLSWRKNTGKGKCKGILFSVSLFQAEFWSGSLGTYWRFFAHFQTWTGWWRQRGAGATPTTAAFPLGASPGWPAQLVGQVTAKLIFYFLSCVLACQLFCEWSAH